MTDLTISNAAFTKIVDIANNSEVMQGLVSAGILPPTFRVVSGSVTLPLAISGVAAVLDASGNPLVLGEGEQIILGSTYATTTVAGTNTAVITLGLAPASTTAPAVALNSWTVAATTADLDEPFSGTAEVDATNKYVTVGLATAVLTAGAANVFLIIV